MRHRKRHSKLSMMSTRRKATLRNMVRSLFKHQKIETIHARAKEARRLAEKVITIAKSDTVAARRMAYSVLGDRDLVAKLFTETAPLFKDRDSGFTRIIILGSRRGDGATMAILELTEKKIVEKLPKKKAKAEETRSEKAVTEDAKRQKPEHEKEPDKDASRIKTIQKTKPTLEEEKRREKAKSEDKKAADKRGFMRNLRGLFRKRGDF